jgi:hypothetical protein
MVDYNHDIVAAIIYLIAMVVNYLGDYTTSNVVIVFGLAMISVVVSFAGRLIHD